MTFRKKLCTGLMVLTIALTQTQMALATELPSELAGEAAVVIEYKTGKILYGKDPHKIMYPASTTKMLTALVVLEHLDLDQVVMTPLETGMADGSAMYLLPGELFTVRELLDAMMVKSANDAAVLLAQTVAGDVESFASLMNARALELGAKDTHFTNPNGLHDPLHVTTAYDLALIGREAMQYPLFRELVSQVNVTLDETPQTPEKRYFRNTNRFLWSNQLMEYEGGYEPIRDERVDGIKTGFTTPAGHCLVSSATKEDMRVISVVLNSPNFSVYSDSRALLDYGLEHFAVMDVVHAGSTLGFWEIPNIKESVLPYTCDQTLAIVYNINKDPAPDIKRKIDLSAIVNEDNQLTTGEPIGSMLVTYEGEEWTLPLLAQSSATIVASKPWLPKFDITFPMVFTSLLVVIFLMVASFFWKMKKNNLRIKRKCKPNFSLSEEKRRF